MLPQVGPSPSPAPLLGGQGQDRRAKSPISAHSRVLEREEKSWQSAGGSLCRNQRFGFARAAASGRFQTFGPRQHQHLPPGRKQLRLQARLRGGREGGRDVALGREGCGSGEPSQVAKGSFPPGHPRAGLELPAAAPDPERGTTQELLSAS